MKFIARVQNLHFNFSCHSLGCGGQIPSARLNSPCQSPAQPPACSPASPALFGGCWRQPRTPGSRSLRRARLAGGVSQRLVAIAFHYTAALTAKQGLIFLTLQKFNGVQFFPLPINYTQGFTWEGVGSSQGRWRPSLDLQERTRHPLQGVSGALLGSTARYTLMAQVMPKCFCLRGKDRRVVSSEDVVFNWRNWRRGRRKGSRMFRWDKFGGRGKETVRNGKECKIMRLLMIKQFWRVIWLKFLTGPSLPLCALCSSPCQTGH